MVAPIEGLCDLEGSNFCCPCLSIKLDLLQPEMALGRVGLVESAYNSSIDLPFTKGMAPGWQGKLETFCCLEEFRVAQRKPPCLGTHTEDSMGLVFACGVLLLPAQSFHPGD